MWANLSIYKSTCLSDWHCSNLNHRARPKLSSSKFQHYHFERICHGLISHLPKFARSSESYYCSHSATYTFHQNTLSFISYSHYSNTYLGIQHRQWPKDIVPHPVARSHTCHHQNTKKKYIPAIFPIITILSHLQWMPNYLGVFRGPYNFSSKEFSYIFI